jgi:hypothetical protein
MAAMPDDETYARFSLLLDPDETIPEDLEPEPEVPKGYVRKRYKPGVVLPDTLEWSAAAQRGIDVEDELLRQMRYPLDPQAILDAGLIRQQNFRFEPLVFREGLGRIIFTMAIDMIPKSVELRAYDQTQDPPGNYFFITDDGEGSLILQQRVRLSDGRETPPLECVGKVDYTSGSAELYFGLLPPVSYIQSRFRIQDSFLSTTA